MCEKDRYDYRIDTAPTAFAAHRRRAWPHPITQFSLTTGYDRYAAIYDVVRATGLPNCLQARVPLPSALNTEAWEHYIDHTTDEADLYDYVRFGFPLGYMGPISPTEGYENHDTADRYPAHVDNFIEMRL